MLELAESTFRWENGPCPLLEPQSTFLETVWEHLIRAQPLLCHYILWPSGTHLAMDGLSPWSPIPVLGMAPWLPLEVELGGLKKEFRSEERGLAT